MVPGPTHANNRKAGPTSKLMPALNFSANVNIQVSFRVQRPSTVSREAIRNFRNVHDISAYIPSLYETDTVGSQFHNTGPLIRAIFIALGCQSCHCATPLHTCRPLVLALLPYRVIQGRKIALIASASLSTSIGDIGTLGDSISVLMRCATVLAEQVVNTCQGPRAKPKLGLVPQLVSG